MTAVLGLGLLSFLLASQGPSWPAAAQSEASTPQAAPCLVDNHWGMMEDWGAMMGPGMMMPGADMMGSMWGAMGSMGMMTAYPATGQPITPAEAAQRAAAFAASCGAGIQVGEIIAFSSSYYVTLIDSSGAGVAEVLVDRYTGAVYPEPGPNMLWNGQWGAGATAAPEYDQAAAQALATTFLAGYLPGASVLEGQAFPGYATFAFGRDHLEGLLSVHAVTGEVWVHAWHGLAIEMEATSSGMPSRWVMARILFALPPRH
jgi:hypothetical protein